MPIRVEINGVALDGFKEISVTSDLDAVSGTFTILTSTKPGNVFPVRVQDQCTILIDDTPILNGFVDYAKISYNADSHDLLFQGRDKTSDLIDSTMPADFILNTPVSLETVARETIKLLPGADIGVSSNVDIEEFNQKSVVEASLSEGAFEFIERYARKRQVLVTADGNGGLLFDRASEEVISTIILNQLGKAGGGNNNVLEAELTIDYRDRFSSYNFESQGNPAYAEILSEHGYDEPDSLVSRCGRAVDNRVRRSRVLNLITESSMTIQEATERAVWEANIRRARSQVYTVKLQGYVANDDGLIWRPNQLVNVVDDFTGIVDVLLINSVVYSLSIDKGSTVFMSLVGQDAYSLEANQSKSDSQFSEFGDEFIED